MFKPGDKVRYIKHNNFFFELEIGEIYTVHFIFLDNTISTLEDEYTYDIECFMLIKEERKQKLQKLCLNQEIL